MTTIKLSKKQWEFIGQKAGWIKNAQAKKLPKLPKDFESPYDESGNRVKPEIVPTLEMVWRKLSPEGKKKYNDIIAINKKVIKMIEIAQSKLEDLAGEADDIAMNNNFESQACYKLPGELQDSWNEASRYHLSVY